MRSRCLLLYVDRLPTISETQEEEEEEEFDPEVVRPGTSMEEYMESIRELSQPPQPCYPLHGPLRGHHRHWGTKAPHCHRTYPAGGSLEPSDVSFTARARENRHLSQNIVDRLVAQAVFAGL